MYDFPVTIATALEDCGEDEGIRGGGGCKVPGTRERLINGGPHRPCKNVRTERISLAILTLRSHLTLGKLRPGWGSEVDNHGPQILMSKSILIQTWGSGSLWKIVFLKFILHLQEFEKVPLFMKKAPSEIDPSANPDLACLQSMIFDEERSPEGILHESSICFVSPLN